MANRSWLPSLWDEREGELKQPFGALRDQIESLFQDFDKKISFGDDEVPIRSNVSETEKDIRITAELPGIEMKDIDITVTGNRIAISGQKKSEKEDKGEEEGRQYRRIERSSGTFYRSMTVPFDIDADTVGADFKNGVLTVVLTKPESFQKQEKKVEIRQAS